MAKISYIDTGILNQQSSTFLIPTDESVGAIIIDISGFNDPFADYPMIYHNFAERKVQKITNMDEASVLGIENNGFLNGLLYYHLSEFYDFIGADQVLYIMLADCSKDWDSIFYLHQQVSGRIFQIGVWTSQPLWKRKEDGSIGFTSLITEMQGQADEINGSVGKPTQTMTPVNILLFGNTAYIDGEPFNYKELPDAVELNCCKVSVILAQNGTEEVKAMQQNNPLSAPVSSLGIVMACLAVCGAEESIASVDNCDLNKNERFDRPEWGVGKKGLSISVINRIWANIISERGYIVPIDYEGEEASYFLSSDQTLAEGDYSSIANNRVMHKCRRAMCSALLPYLNSHHIYNVASKSLDPSSVSMISTSVGSMLDTILMNRKGQKQINSKSLEFLYEDDLLETDTIKLKLIVVPANYSEAISEDVSHSLTQ